MLDLAGLADATGAECAAMDGAGTPRDRRAAGRRLFELCCAYEQVWADLALVTAADRRGPRHAAARAFGALASDLAEHVLFRDGAADPLAAVAARCRAEVAAAADLAAADLDRREGYVNPPECFTRDLIDLDGYAAFARGHAAARAGTSAVVVGIRTSGSYLAPIWDAALRVEGCRTVTVTARPRRAPQVDTDGRFTDPAPDEVWTPPAEDDTLVRTAVAGWDLAATGAVVIDDLAFTGSSFVRVDNYLTGLGIDGRRTDFAQDLPVNPAFLTAAAAARLASRRPLTAPRVPDGPDRLGEPARRFFADLLSRTGRDVRVDGVELAPPTFAQRHLAARTTVPPAEHVHFTRRGRDRHHLLTAEVNGRPTRLFAKVFGVGHTAERELDRIRRFGDGGYAVVALAGGFLLYEWIDGRPLGPDEADRFGDEDIDRLAEYAATLSHLNRTGRLDPATHIRDVADRVRRVLPAGRSIDATAHRWLPTGGSVPTVEAPRNQGHWHHIRAAEGRLRRVHLDLGEWSWTMDPAEELAAAVLELGLSAAQAQRLAAGYAARTGDEGVAARMPLGTVSYAARLLDSYHYWDGQLRQMPARYRRPADHPSVLAEQVRRTRVEDALHRAVAGGDSA